MVLGACKTILGVLRDQHGHGLGQGVDQPLLSAYDICLYVNFSRQTRISLY